MNFNEVVGVDLIQINVPEIGDYWMLNCLCWGTDMQIVEIVKDKQASTVLETFCRAWIAHYGPPALVVADQGREFIGHQFTDYVGHMGVPVHFINARSPWENGRTERAGGIFKSRLEGALHEVGATTEEELKLTIQEVVTAHNRFYNRTGFTPYQRAFGTLPRMPAFTSMITFAAMMARGLRRGLQEFACIPCFVPSMVLPSFLPWSVFYDLPAHCAR